MGNTVRFQFYQRISQSVERRARGWTYRIQFPAVQNFSLLHRVQIESGAHPASYTMCIGALPPGEQSGRGVKLTTRLHNAKVKKGGAVLPLPQYVFVT
jgi:hypothetical protein